MTDILSLKQSIDNLNNSINSLIKVFKDAGEELEKSEPKEIDEKVTPLMQKIAMLEEQNEKIARGIVAVADMLKERERRPVYRQQQPVIRPTMPRNFQPQPTGGPQNFQMPTVKPLPKEPEKKEEKKGFLDMFKK